MLQVLTQKNVILYGMLVISLLGGLSQLMLHVLYGKLIGEMENGGVGNGKFMKQVLQRYGTNRRMNQGNMNIELFVKRNVMEYTYLGRNLHQWRRMGAMAFLFCVLLGGVALVIGQVQNSLPDLWQRYGIAVAVSGAFIFSMYAITDNGYRGRYLETGLKDFLENSGVGQNYQPVEVKEEAPVQAVVETGKKRGRSETRAEKDKRELKENLARLKEGISESAAAKEREKERNTEILKQMDPAEQERVMREVLKEFLV